MMSIALCASATNTSATVEYSDSTLHLSEISITAVKTVAHEGETPGSATSLPRYEVERRNIVNTKDVSITVPNFYIPDYGSRVTSSIYVRGIGARIDQPVIGFNIDNIPVLNKDNYDFDLLDIESIEACKHPHAIASYISRHTAYCRIRQQELNKSRSFALFGIRGEFRDRRRNLLHAYRRLFHQFI